MKMPEKKIIQCIKALITNSFLKNRNQFRVSEMSSYFKVSRIYNTRTRPLTCKMSQWLSQKSTKMEDSNSKLLKTSIVILINSFCKNRTKNKKS